MIDIVNSWKWNPWHGCCKISEGCAHCYVDRLDKRFGRELGQYWVTDALYKPVRVDRYGRYKIPSGSVILLCFTSDFLFEKADSSRGTAWNIIRERSDCIFYTITKRIDRFKECTPSDWGDGWDNFHVACTIESKRTANYRIPIFLDSPIKHKHLCVEPLLEEVDITPALKSGKIESVICGGESGSGARVCNIEWVKSLYSQCKEYGVEFCFKQTGARLIDKSVSESVIKVARGDQFERAISYGLNDYNIINTD